MPLPLVGLVTKGISGGIGLASEAIADHKERKAAKQAQTATQSTDPEAQKPSNFEKHSPENDSDSLSDDSHDLDTDQANWELDEAAAELTSPPPYEEHSPDRVSGSDDLVKSFVEKHQLTSSIQEFKPLPQPIILPQRRPKDKSRGFIRAYAPILGECSGIEEQVFIDFLNDLDKASKASPVFDVINLACFAAGLVPNPIAMGVTIAVQVAARTAKEVQFRYRSNTYLDQINETLFKPRGLYCMIMTFKPDAANQAVLDMNISSHDQALVKSLSNPDSEIKQKLKNLRLTSGVSKGEFSLPESAPLVYPALDNAAITAANQTSTSSSPPKQNALKTSTAFLPNYLDRRAQAIYSATHPTSKLSTLSPASSNPNPSTSPSLTSEHKQFASRFSDPNHPVNSGSIVSLLTGGNYNPQSNKRVRKAQRRAARRGQVLTENDIANAAMGRRRRIRRDGTEKKTLIGRVMHKDVLYLTVVNLPSESEMMEMRQEIEKWKSQKGTEGFPGLR